MSEVKLGWLKFAIVMSVITYCGISAHSFMKTWGYVPVGYIPLRYVVALAWDVSFPWILIMLYK
jgi:hypothetical protein